MTELSPEAKKLLEVAREEFSPADQRIDAVRSAVELRISLARGSGGAGGGSGPAAWSGWGASQLVGIGLVAIGVTTAAGVFVARSLSASSETHREPSTSERAKARASAAVPDAPAVVLADRPRAQATPPQAMPQALDAQPTALGAHAATIGSKRTASSTKKRESVAPAPRAAGATNAHDSGRARTSSATSRTPNESVMTAAAASPTAAASIERQASNPNGKEPPAEASTAAAATPHEPAQVRVTDDQARPRPDDSLARELALLRDARNALDRHDPARALALADQHAALFASGTMRQEQLATRVLALCALKRRAEAIAAERELTRIAPRSPHLMRIRSSCVAQGASSEVK
jgi:hypothetical protein